MHISNRACKQSWFAPSMSDVIRFLPLDSVSGWSIAHVT
ncbi:protein of unknown function (plasmid) [Caballeronia sp. S22]